MVWTWQIILHKKLSGFNDFVYFYGRTRRSLERYYPRLIGTVSTISVETAALRLTSVYAAVLLARSRLFRVKYGMGRFEGALYGGFSSWKKGK
jgi:hypothetical protein